MDCEIHNIIRAQAEEKMAILNGTHPINIQANSKKRRLVKPGAFSETSFKFIGDSVVLFSLHDYFSDDKIRNDIDRKYKNRRDTS